MAQFDREIVIPRPAYLGGNNWTIKNLNHVTVLFGRNGSGKSKLLRQLRDSNNSDYHYASPERGGDISIDASLVQNELTPGNRANRRQGNFAQTYRQEVFSRIQSLLLKIGNLAGKKKEIRIDLNDVEHLLSTLLPSFRFEITAENPPYIITRVSSEERVNNVNELSTGEAEILSLALDILTISLIWDLEDHRKRVLLLDEPDAHLHPDLQQNFAQFLVELVGKYDVQVIIATHSTTLLSALGYHGRDKTSVIYLSSSHPELLAVPFDRSLQDLSTCLGGHALMGPLFASPLLLVEGDDEFKIWSQVPRYHQTKIAVIPCDGSDEVKRYQKTLEAVFGSIREATDKPVGYALLDGDKTVPQENADRPQKHVKYVRLSCLESENLYLSDEVLAELNTNWEDAKAKIKAESNKYGNKSDLLNGCDAWNRKTTDVKSVIKELELILDPKQLPWTLRVARTIGTKKPEGMLADFLGENVVRALW